MNVKATNSLAIHGGKPAVKGRIEPFFTIGGAEIRAAVDAMKRPLSGYLGGELKGGYWTQRLEREWEATFHCKHAIAVNSATSGLLIACAAAGVSHGDTVTTTPFTMSASAAAPAFLGARIDFADIEPQQFTIHPHTKQFRNRAVIATNLFGHPARLSALRAQCSVHGSVLIEDNAQAIFAREDGRYAGTIGHIGVHSLNVHKQLNCGEGGICTTDDDGLAARMRGLMNHGELAGGPVGLNLRMTETAAAIACTQLSRAQSILRTRIALAEALNDMTKGLPGIEPPSVRLGCESSWYAWALRVPKHRQWFVAAMRAEGVPLNEGTYPLIYNLPAFKSYKRVCPVAEKAESEIAIFEICGHAPAPRQVKQFKMAFEKVCRFMDRDLRE